MLEVMSITGKGTVATGRIERGLAKTGDTIDIVGYKDPGGTSVLGAEGCLKGFGGRVMKK